MNTAQNIVNVCIASDNNYAPLIATTIASVCFNTTRYVKFWCLESGISDMNKRLIDSLHGRFSNFEIEYITIKPQLINDFASRIATSGHISPDTYSRLFIPDLFPKMQKMVYLDVDLIATGDIGELYDIDLGRYELGAVAADYGVDKSKWFQNMEMNNAHQYFNAGVLLMNPMEMHNNGFLGQISEVANKYSKYIVLGDQDLLNRHYNHDYLELPWRFNLTTRFIEMELGHKDLAHQEQMKAEYSKGVIRHFESSKKPWNAERNECNGAKIKNMSDFWAVAAMTPYLTWFERQFQISKLERVQGNIWQYINSGKAMRMPHSYKLFGILPILRRRHHGNKTQYMLLGLIPVLGCKVKNNGKKHVWRLFDFITIMTTKY